LGLRVYNSQHVTIYGAGLYSFFNNYSTTCSNGGGPENCQSEIFRVDGTTSALVVYTLSTIGTINMITVNGQSQAVYSSNVNVFPDTIAQFTYN
jgi:glucan 1,3-beta-glucosidase